MYNLQKNEIIILQQSYQLTKFPIGSLREMWQISYPLMLAFLSGSMMMVADRIYLTHYSLEALTACVNGGITVFLFTILPMLTAGIAEVFVGQYHGANEHKRMGEPVWQMLWLSLFTIPFFFLLAAYAGPYLFAGTGNEALEIAYFSTLLPFAPLMCAGPALGGFFAAKGSVKMVTLCTVVMNVINVGLDPLLIFGWGPFPEMGITGAALATGIAHTIGVALYLSIFLRSPYRKRYGTGDWSFRPSAFWHYAKVGLPGGLSHFNEMIGHFFFFRLVIMAGGYGMTIMSLVQSVYISGFFILEGTSKAVSAIVSNLIGARQHALIDKVLLSAIKLITLFSLLFAVLIVGNPEALFSLMMAEQDRSLLLDPLFLEPLIRTCWWVSLFFFADGLYWIFVGALTAAGDTKFILAAGVVCTWLVYFLPVYLALHVFEASIDVGWMAIAISSFVLAATFFVRYRTSHYEPLRSFSKSPGT